MAIIRIYPDRDTFISTELPTANSGKDEILEIGGYPDISEQGQTLRTLISFPTQEIVDTVENTTGEWKASLGMYLATAYELPTNYTVKVSPLSRTWDVGIGKYGDSPVNISGTSWTYRKAGGSNLWVSGSFITNETASYKVGQEGGGTWFDNYTVSQSRGITDNHDLNIDVTNSIKAFISGTIENNGFIIKLDDSLESQTTSSILLKYYGGDSNTIFPPFLQIGWDDSTFSTGSLTELTGSQYLVEVINNRGKYKDEGKVRFRLSCRPKYLQRTFTTTSPYLQNWYLPEGSTWGIKDENSEERVIDFDTQHTRISCDSEGNFFDLHLGGLQPERYYRVLIKTGINGDTTLLETKATFKVTRNG